MKRTITSQMAKARVQHYRCVARVGDFEVWAMESQGKTPQTWFRILQTSPRRWRHYRALVSPGTVNVSFQRADEKDREAA